MDEDGVPNNVDNCPRKPNPDQRDWDRDGLGDICDNCPKHSNPGQEDSDNDLIGDACDEPEDRDRYQSIILEISREKNFSNYSLQI